MRSTRRRLCRANTSIQMVKKKNVEAPATEPAPEVIATETVANDHTEAVTPAPKTKKAKKPKTDPNVTLTDVAERYLAHMEDSGKSTGTCFSYRLDLVTALDELGKDTKLADLTPQRVLDFFVSDRVMRTKTGVEKAPPTFKKTRRVLRLALVWAQEAGLVEKAPLPEDAAAY